MSGPLAGVRVIDLTTVILGPYATQILGDLGADVIKVEPHAGDNMRWVAPFRRPGMAHIFLHLNRNKRSIVLDLKRPEGLEAVLRLTASADVFVHNVRPQAIARLGLAYEDVRAINPRIVYVGAYGFRRDGPYGDRAAYDDIIQGLTALPMIAARVTGERPRYVPSTICNRITGLNVVNAVTAALFHRERTGEGQAIEVTMFEAMTEFVLGDHMAGATWQPPIAPMGYPRLLAPDRNPYRTKDGYLGLLVYNDKQWQSLFAAIGRPELYTGDQRFSSLGQRSRHIEEVYAFLADIIAERTIAEWLDVLGNADIPVMPVHTLESLLEDPHLASVGFFRSVDHPTEGLIRVMDTPSRWSASPPAYRLHAPLLGEHSIEILREAGYSPGEVEGLLTSGVTAAPLA